MFRIWPETCRRSTLGEVLIMAATNVASALIVTDRSESTTGTAPHTEILQAQEIVMAKVIEFYIPKSYRKPIRTAAQLQLGKIIEFCPQTKRSA